MEETVKILILTKEKKNVAFRINNAKIQIEIADDFNPIIKKLDNELYDSYDYLLFAEKDLKYIYIGHYFPINIDNKNRNQIFINEILYNSIIIDNIKCMVNEEHSIQIGIMLRHILRKDIKYNDFDFNQEIKYISDFNKYNKKDSRTLKRNIYDAVKEHYSQNSFLRKIKFLLRKKVIVKKFLFKIYNNIIEDTKKNTEINLVFKELVGIIK